MRHVGTPVNTLASMVCDCVCTHVCGDNAMRVCVFVCVCNMYLSVCVWCGCVNLQCVCMCVAHCGEMKKDEINNKRGKEEENGSGDGRGEGLHGWGVPEVPLRGTTQA